MSPPKNTNILWIDCEMTGLHPYLKPADVSTEAFRPDVILEIAAIVTNSDLETLDDGVEYIVKTEKATLDNMNQWCVAQHGKTGLTASCLASTTTMEDVDGLVAEYIKKHFPQGQAILAGSSVHADAAFIKKDLPKVASLLHYRIIDVSSLKELAVRWYPEVRGSRKEASAHRALSDIMDSINELKVYRERIMIKKPTSS